MIKSKSFEDMTNQELIKAFEIVLESPNHLRWGFDYVDNEAFRYLVEKISTYHRKQLGTIFGIDGNVTVKKLFDLFTDDDGLRIGMWRELFKRLDREDKITILQDNERYYLETLPYIEREEYDWSEFSCVLENEGQYSQLRQIKSGWNELGMQVYGCSSNDNGKMCPCLRHASDTTAYKCFRDYLEENNKTPYDKIPLKLLGGNY
ncbi:hypothetical protein Elgi_37760 [Paenibacillus elgii]|uniref:hypothetical protein n=1 Tax=Paenibacillus elgii TaxID=189691 RepID=UPI002D7AC103|nr:hypothetical protein Elgi_37760 [Paenibacillus elgii]